MATWQDLVSDHGLPHGYQTVKRFVRKVRGSESPQRFPQPASREQCCFIVSIVQSDFWCQKCVFASHLGSVGFSTPVVLPYLDDSTVMHSTPTIVSTGLPRNFMTK
jgi:hypothetical protein